MPSNEENLTEEQTRELELHDNMWNRWGEIDAAIAASKLPVSPEEQTLWDIFQEELRKEIDAEYIKSLKEIAEKS